MPAGRVTNDPTNYFAIAQQSALNSDGTVWYFTKHMTGTGFDVAVDVSSERVGGSGREVGLRYRTKVTADGTFVAYAQPDFVGRVAALALFQDTVAAGPSQLNTAYYSTHSIFSGASVPLYFTAEQTYADITERTGNNVLSSLKFEGEKGKPITVTAAFMSGGTPHSTVSPQSPTREAAFPFMYPGGSACILVTGSAISPGAASSIELTKWSVEAKTQLDGDIQTNALNREDMLVLNNDYEVNATAKYINNGIWEQIVYSGGSNVPTGLLAAGQFTFYTQSGDSLYGKPNLSSVMLFCPFIEFPSVKVNRLDPDGKTMYLDISGATRNIGTSSLQITVVTPASTSYAISTT
jgi:hypothetical protein